MLFVVPSLSLPPPPSEISSWLHVLAVCVHVVPIKRYSQTTNRISNKHKIVTIAQDIWKIY